MPAQPPALPIQFNLLPFAIIDEAKQLVSNATKLWDELAQIPLEEATFSKVILPILHEENERASRIRVLSFFDNVSPDEELRNAATEIKSISDRAHVERWAREDVFRLLVAVERRGEELDYNEKLMLKIFREEFVKNGLAIPDPAQRKRLKEITIRVRDVQRQYRINIDNDVSGIWFTPDELVGISPTQVEKWKADDEGKRFVNFKRPNRFAIMQSAERGDVRKRMWLTFEDRFKEANNPLHKELLELRDERARLLGYKHHALAREGARMLKTETAVNFVNSLKKSLKGVGETQMAELRGLKAAHLASTNSRENDDPNIIFHWDVPFYQNRKKAQDFKLDQDHVVEYFPYDFVLTRILSMLELLFGVQFRKLGPGETTTWHPDVAVYTVWDEEKTGGDFLGYLYLDVFPRDFKHSHRSHYGLQKRFVRADGTENYPSSVLLVNFPPPSATKPSLLPYIEVVSCFHELTHAVHNLVQHTSRPSPGPKPLWRILDLLPRDYTEIPCRTVEHFFTDINVLRAMSAHYVTGEMIPRELAAAVVASQVAAPDALKALADLYIASYDLTIHTPQTREEMLSLDPAVVAGRLRREVTLRRGEEGTHGYTHLRLIISGSYDSVYYTYSLADAYSYDIFESKFRQLLAKEDKDSLEETINDALRVEGRRFRKKMLEGGDSTESYLRLIKDVLGRDPDVGAYTRSFKGV